MGRYKAVVEYDGTEFLGFQRQAQGRTVQGDLEEALRRIGWNGKSILAAGRTDAGVHAAGQVIAFDFDWAHGAEALLRAFNVNLPYNLCVKSVAECAPEFHPRFWAKARHYRYSIYNAPVRSPLRARYTWHVWTELHLDVLQAVSAELLGRKDFATFGSDPDGGPNTVRTIQYAEWRRAGDEWHFDIQADAFLYRMVRSIVGALKLVGAGELTVADFRRLIDARDRTLCPPIAPASGLCLMNVIY